MNKNTTLNKYLALIVTFFCALAFGYGQQTILAAGDIAITGFNADDPDEFTFVLLTDVTATTEIKFTDEGWLAIGGFRGNTEGFITWTADSDLICGTEIIIKDTGAIVANSYSASSGTAAETGGGFGLAVNVGDQILAYQGLEATPTFIYAINFDGAGWSNATSPNDTALPTGLTDTVNAVSLGQTDNGSYNCSVTTDQALILTATSNNANWDLSNDILLLGGCTYTCTIVCPGVPVEWLVGGGWDNVIGPDINSDVTISGNYVTNVATPSFSACNLTIVLGGTLTIDNGYYVEVNNNLTTTGDITVAPQGAFIQNNNTGGVNGVGIVSVEKLTADMNAWYEYTYWSSPVSGETVGDALTDADANRRFLFDGSNFKDAFYETGNGNILVAGGGVDDVDDDNNDWQFVNAATIMMPGVGYASTLDETVFNFTFGFPKQFKFTFVGAFNNGIIPVTIYRNDEELADTNWNLVGNPYPSAIDVDLFFATNSSIIDGAIYLWSQNLDPEPDANGNQNLNFSTSDYAIINGTAESAGGDGLPPNRYIPSGQGFFVSMSNTSPFIFHTIGDGAIPGDIVKNDITFNNAMRVKGTTDNSQFFRMASEKSQKVLADKNKLWVNLTSDNGVFNQAVIGYVSGATNNYDGTYYDAARNLSTGAAAILYTNIEGSNKKFAIQGKAENSINEDEVISLGFKTTIDVATIYTLSIAQLEGDFLGNNAIYVKDNLLNVLHDLKTGDYNFTSVVGEFNERFEIVFNSEALSTDEHFVKNKALSIIEQQSGDVQFKLSGNLAMASIQIIDLQGRVLYNLNASGNSKTYNLSNLSQAPYIAKVTLTDGYVITKKAIKRH